MTTDKGIKSYNIVLVEPEIPQNTGNIIRLCACSKANLYLVGPIGFSLTSKYLKRSGLDYHDFVDVHRVVSLEELWEKNPNSNFFYFTTKTNKEHYTAPYKEGDFLVFGPETRGLDEKLLEEKKDFCYTIPMIEHRRSLNLSNSVAIVLYEAIRHTYGA